MSSVIGNKLILLGLGRFGFQFWDDVILLRTIWSRLGRFDSGGGVDVVLGKTTGGRVDGCKERSGKIT